MNPKVDAVLGKATKWRQELQKLRTIILDCGLTEELKWGKPCYTFQNSNIVFYFSAPKQSKTRAAMVEKCLPQILKGKGLND